MRSIAVIRTSAYLYACAICLLWFIDNCMGGYINWFMGSLLLITLIALFLRKPMFDQVLGVIVMLGAMYMLLAVIYSYGRGMDKGHVDAAVRVLWVGGAISLLCFLAGCALLGIAIFSPVRK